MKRAAVERLLSELVEVVPASVRAAGLKPNACILASRLGVEALRARGVRARALSVELEVFNAEYVRRMREHGPPATAEEVESWRAAGAKLLTIDRSGNGSGWPGHLVVIADERYLVELTAAQFARPRHGIKGEPFWLEARPLARGGVVQLSEDDGSVWEYRARPEDRSFVTAPAWSAYRIRRTRGGVVSERTGPAPDAPVAATIFVPVEGGK